MKNWVPVEADDQTALRIHRESGHHPAVCRLLASRGLTRADAIDRFLNPRLSDISDPFEMAGMDRAAARVWSAIDAGEMVVIYGDYDVDGVTSTALLFTVLSALGGRARMFLPHRVDDGYGLGVGPLRRCIEEHQPGLVITVDCGTGSVDAVHAAREADVDVVITDHHEPAGEPAPAHAIVNPKLGAPAPAASLAGVGVAFKLCHALIKTGRDGNHEAARQLDLRGLLKWVALGTVVDLAPLEGENRILVRHGLDDLNAGAGIGLEALKAVGGVRGPVDTYHLGFVLGPRLNAAGRLGGAEAALELLLCRDDTRARALAGELDAANRERQAMEARMVEEACAEIDSTFDPDRDFGLVVARDGWHPGVIGIVASRLVNRYNRPVIVIGFDDEGTGKGSCRSFASFHLVNGLAECAEYLAAYGGHAQAAGLTIERDQVKPFRQAFNAVAARELQGTDLRPQLRIDAWIDMAEIDDRMLEAVEALRPFGLGNPKPVWAVRGARLLGPPRIVGRGHVKMLVTAGAAQREAIGFGMGDREIPDGPIDLAFRLNRNEYMGRTTIQLVLEDFRETESA